MNFFSRVNMILDGRGVADILSIQILKGKSETSYTIKVGGSVPKLIAKELPIVCFVLSKYNSI